MERKAVQTIGLNCCMLVSFRCDQAGALLQILLRESGEAQPRNATVTI